MEYLITGGILYMAYQLQTSKKDDLKKKFVGKVSKNKIPSTQNTYTSKRSYNIFQEEQKKADVLLEKSLQPQDTNVITPGPSFPIIYNKVDYTDSQLPIEFNSYQKYDDIVIDDKTSNINALRNAPDNKIQNNKSVPESGGFNGISLTGDPINPNTFTHNNQVPFFGGNVRQNLDEFSTRGIFENFTGTMDTYQKKQEIGLLFEPQKNMSNVYGTGSLDGFMIDRYYVSNIRSNETPVEKVYVGPGLNQGYTNEPSGGFQQENTLDYVMPKTTDEIRVKTNPKISYYGRIVSGQKIAKPGKVGTLYKNRPDTFYIQEPDRYFTTTGAVVAQEQRPCIVTRYTNRKTTELKTRTGSAAPVHGTVAQIRSKYKISPKITYKNDGMRNANLTGTWAATIQNMLGMNKIPNDYGKESIKIRNNNRVLNKNAPTVVNFKLPVQKGTTRNKQKPRYAKKNDLIDNNRINGNYQGPTKSPVYDPNNVPKQTIKETNIHNNHSGMMSPSGPSKLTVYDPNDIARTTIKETNIYNDSVGSNVQNMTRGNTVYDPNDIARTTIKETNIYNDSMGSNIQNINRGNVVYDPKNVPRQTTKETTIENKRKANIKNGNGSYIKSKDKPKKTMKQTTMASNVYGIATESRNDGHVIREVQVPETIREYSSVQYMGDATGPEQGGYNVTDVGVVETNRQHTADIEYFGGAGNNEVKPISYEDVYNAEIKAIRGVIDKGYMPNPGGINEILDSSTIHMTTNKIGDIQNQYLTERGTQANKVYNSIPQMDATNISSVKEIVPNEPLADRINPEMVRILKDNPYSQSLTSWS